VALSRRLIGGALIGLAVVAGAAIWLYVRPRRVEGPVAGPPAPSPKVEVKPAKPKSAAERHADLKRRYDELAKKKWDESLFGEFEGIIQDARALQQAFPNSKEGLQAQELAILAYEKQGKFPQRFEAFLQYVEMGEKVYDREMASKILLLEANRNFKNKEFLTANRFYEEVLSRYPEGKVADIARFQVGRCFEEVGDWQVALRKYKAIMDAPAGASGMKLDAWKQTYEVYARRGRTQQALDTLQGICGHYKDKPEARWAHLEKGAYLWRLGKNAEALRVLHEVKKLYPGAPEAGQAEQYIKRIEAAFTNIEKGKLFDLPK